MGEVFGISVAVLLVLFLLYWLPVIWVLASDRTEGVGGNGAPASRATHSRACRQVKAICADSGNMSGASLTSSSSSGVLPFARHQSNALRSCPARAVSASE